LTAKVPNPQHRGGTDLKICHWCGEEIKDKKWVTKATHNKKRVNKFRQYHTACWEGLFI